MENVILLFLLSLLVIAIFIIFLDELLNIQNFTFKRVRVCFKIHFSDKQLTINFLIMLKSYYIQR